MIDRLREDILPTVTAPGDEVHVGGQTAIFVDLADRVAQRLPWFIGGVVLLSCILLALVFRSLLIPLQAAVMNVLSIGAALGVVVAVFQHGVGLDLVGLDEPVPIISFVPLMMFAILFGLSMDYQVFLLSAVREAWLESDHNRKAVTTGLARTGRVITSAALIMMAVFASFILSDDPLLKIFGLGLTVAILLDATVVRCVLVPAIMVLSGRANWWLPPAVGRRLPPFDVEPGYPTTTRRTAPRRSTPSNTPLRGHDLWRRPHRCRRSLATGKAGVPRSVHVSQRHLRRYRKCRFPMPADRRKSQFALIAPAPVQSHRCCIPRLGSPRLPVRLMCRRPLSPVPRILPRGTRRVARTGAGAIAPPCRDRVRRSCQPRSFGHDARCRQPREVEWAR